MKSRSSPAAFLFMAALVMPLAGLTTPDDGFAGESYMSAYWEPLIYMGIENESPSLTNLISI